MRICTKCKKEKPVSEFYKNIARGDGLNYHCKTCCKSYERVRQSTWYRPKRLKNMRDYHRRLKKAVVSAYGGKCACCGERRFEFLQIDHRNGGGRKHRSTIGVHMAAYLKAAGYPKKGYRLLCANCNFSIGIYGYCPHKK